MNRFSCTLSRTLWLGLCALVFAFGSVTMAAEVDRADAQKIRTLIESQIAAFAADDATRAFSYAAPGIRSTVGTPERFMDMVRSNYPVVYRPKALKFLSIEEIGGQTFQAVNMTDGNGGLWVALYSLERQPDKSWRISGCVVRKSEGETI